MYRKFMIEGLLARNMSIGSNMQYSVTDVSSEGLYEFFIKSSSSRTNLPEICLVGQNGFIYG